MFHVKHAMPENLELTHQKRILRLGVEILDLSLEDNQMQGLESYLSMLLAWNHRINLFSRRDETRIVERHFLESIAWIPLFSDVLASPVMDLGSGAGFPGIPLAICRPELSLTLVESVGKKARFLQEVCQNLGVNARVLNTRVENIAEDRPAQHRYPWIIARAVAPVVTLVKWARPLLQTGGFLLTFKGDKMNSEIDSLKQLKLSLAPRVYEFEVPTNLTGSPGKRLRRALCIKLN